MQRTKVVETEIASPTTAGTASSISNAKCLRLHNNTSGVATVGVSTLVGAATTVYFSIPANTVEFLEKEIRDVIWTTPAIRVSKVGFSN
jgi:hypothetical protein